MKLTTRLAIVAVASFIFAGGFGLSSVAYADESSSPVLIGTGDLSCARAIATTHNSGTQRGQLNVTGYGLSVPGCTTTVQAQPTGYLGSSAYLRTAGGVCSSVPQSL
ncbi:MAG: hypothetical protein J0H23_09805 [Micrococcales bacterium]|nr:hypothetical protein [Micrococcales bacterium]